MPELKTYTGGCHCRKVRFEVQMQLGQVTACNCSMCSKRATLLSFAPAAQFKLLSGEDALTDYQFNKRSIHHLFCSTCGILSYTAAALPDGTPMRGINARCLDGVDVDALEVVHFNGRDR
jgi:hypothetical protein